jgi:hypothetical protein
MVRHGIPIITSADVDFDTVSEVQRIDLRAFGEAP